MALDELRDVFAEIPLVDWAKGAAMDLKESAGQFFGKLFPHSQNSSRSGSSRSIDRSDQANANDDDASNILKVCLGEKYDIYREKCRAKIHKELLQIEANMFDDLSFSDSLKMILGGNPFESSTSQVKTENDLGGGGIKGMFREKQDRLRSGVRELVRQGHENLQEKVVDETKEAIREVLPFS